MNLISHFIKIRFLQINRELKGIGPVSFIVCAGLVFLTGAGIFQLLISADPHSHYNYYITAAIVAIIFFIHINRKDKKFISALMEKPAPLYFIEYFLFTLPFILLILISGNGWCALLLLFCYGCIAITNYNFNRKSTRINLSRYTTHLNVEWIAGFRKNSILFIGIYTAALVFSFVNVLTLALLWLLTIIISSFYEECEPYEVIASSELTPKVFLNQKLEAHLKLYTALIAPVILLYCYLNPASVLFALCFVIGGGINIAYFIVSKYMLYEPQAQLRGNAVNYGLALMGIIMIFLLPVPLIMLFRNYKRAILNLQNYLYAYH